MGLNGLNIEHNRGCTMIRTLAILMMALVAVALAAPAYAAGNAVNVAENSAYVKYLTDSDGLTLYWFAKDSAGQSVCAGPCITKWPAFYREEVAASDGLNAADFGTITRADGSKQTTFRGFPLYYFAGDKAAGDANGDGLGGVWFTVDPGNFPVR